MRKTSNVLQLFIVIFMLEVLNFDMYGCKTPAKSPAFSVNCETEDFREDSIYLRAGKIHISSYNISYIWKNFRVRYDCIHWNVVSSVPFKSAGYFSLLLQSYQ